MMRAKITMPAVLMHDGRNSDLYTKFSLVAQKAGVYTAKDYADIISALVEEWKVAGLLGLSDASAKAQEYLCGLAGRYQKVAELIKISGSEKFSWIYDREVSLSPIS